jgi:hypothetical protein
MNLFKNADCEIPAGIWPGGHINENEEDCELLCTQEFAHQGTNYTEPEDGHRSVVLL